MWVQSHQSVNNGSNCSIEHMQPGDLLSNIRKASECEISLRYMVLLLVTLSNTWWDNKELDQGVLTYWKERTMAVTIPMIMSKTAAIQRNPPQEVKSTCNEKQVINGMKVKLTRFLPHERDCLNEDQNYKGGEKKAWGWRMCHVPAKKKATSSSGVASDSEVEFSCYHKMS